MKQGSLSLNIETFELNELFELLRKGSRTFEMKRQSLEVQPTDIRVKADKSPYIVYDKYTGRECP